MNHYKIRVFIFFLDCITDLTLDLDEINNKLQSEDYITREMTMMYLIDINIMKEHVNVNNKIINMAKSYKATIELDSII